MPYTIQSCPAPPVAGYSGTAILSKDTPLSVSCGIGDPEHDGEVGSEAVS